MLTFYINIKIKPYKFLYNSLITLNQKIHLMYLNSIKFIIIQKFLPFYSRHQKIKTYGQSKYFINRFI
jgi:hypothetical protein